MSPTPTSPATSAPISPTPAEPTEEPGSTSTDITTDALTDTRPADRIVVLGTHGQREVRARHIPHTVRTAGSCATALPWAWNITHTPEVAS